MALKIKHVKNRAKMTQSFHRDSYWEIPYIIKVLKRNKNKKKYFNIKNHRIKTTSHKNNLFINNNIKYNGKCVCDICGLEAKYFALEKSLSNINDIYHLNLYTIDKNNIEVYFNIDHICPRSKGGKNDMSNLQLTCENCNTYKGNEYDDYNKLAKPKLFINKLFNKFFKYFNIIRI